MTTLTNRMPFRIDWGKCDPAGITFYPNYFAWFDASTWQLFELAGFAPKDLIAKDGIYIPIVDAHGHFVRPGNLGDDLVMESHVAEWRERFFTVKHRALLGGELILEGEEMRAWVIKRPEDPRRFSTLVIPDEVKQAFA
jgi:4-hydroxybenzoyl-CoA thioesterase